MAPAAVCVSPTISRDASADGVSCRPSSEEDEVVEQRILGRQRESNLERSRFGVRVAKLVVGVERDRIGGIPEQPSPTLREVEVHLCPGALQGERDLAHHGAGHLFADRRGAVASGLHDFCLISGAQYLGDRSGLVVGAAPEGFNFLLELSSNSSGPGEQRGARVRPRRATLPGK